MYRGIRIALRSLCAFVATLSLAQTVTFTPDLLTNNSFLFNGAVAADLNNDGREDLIWTGINDQKLFVYFGNGDNGFTVGPTSTLNIQGQLAIGDFDGDGKVDIVSQATQYGTSVQVAYGDGQGHFQATASFGTNIAY